MFDLMQDAYFNKSIDLANKIQRQYRASGRYSRGVRQDILWVLSQSAMPSILTEIGFLSNSSEAAFMLSSEGQQAIASSIVAGFGAYYRTYRGKSSRLGAEKGADSLGGAGQEEAVNNQEIYAAPTADRAQTSTPPQRNSRKGEMQSQDKSSAATQDKTKKSREEKVDASAITYRVQFLSSPDKIDTEDACFRKLPTAVERVKAGQMYLYLLAPTATKAEAQRQLQALPKTYHDAYIVRYRGKTRL